MTGGQVCALAGCENRVPSGQERRYCCPAHRKIARRQRRASTLAKAHAPATKPSGQVSARPVAVPAQLIPVGAPGPLDAHRWPDAPDAPTVRIRVAGGYRRLVPEPRPGWWRRSARRPFAARGVRAARPEDALAPLPSHPEWLWPASYLREVPAPSPEPPLPRQAPVPEHRSDPPAGYPLPAPSGRPARHIPPVERRRPAPRPRPEFQPDGRVKSAGRIQPGGQAQPSARVRPDRSFAAVFALVSTALLGCGSFPSWRTRSPSPRRRGRCPMAGCRRT